MHSLSQGSFNSGFIAFFLILSAGLIFCKNFYFEVSTVIMMNAYALLLRESTARLSLSFSFSGLQTKILPQPLSSFSKLRGCF